MWRAYKGIIHCAFDQISNLKNCFAVPTKTKEGRGLRQINTCRQVPLLVNFLEKPTFRIGVNKLFRPWLPPFLLRMIYPQKRVLHLLFKYWKIRKRSCAWHNIHVVKFVENAQKISQIKKWSMTLHPILFPISFFNRFLLSYSTGLPIANGNNFHSSHFF